MAAPLVVYKFPNIVAPNQQTLFESFSGYEWAYRLQDYLEKAVPTSAGTGGQPGPPGTVDITATVPIAVTPSPITNAGVISHLPSGVTPGTYGDATHVPEFTVEGDGHVTAVTLVPITGAGGGFLKGQPFTSSGTFTVPANVTSLWITLIAGGGAGGGSTGAAFGGGGGGSGETCFGVQYAVVSGNMYTVTVGAGGIAVSGANGGSGGNSLFDILRVFGGVGGNNGALSAPNGAGGTGGGFGGGTGGGASHPIGVTGLIGIPESSLYFGGSGGGGGGNQVTASGGTGAGSGGFVGGVGGFSNSITGTNAGGGGGGSTYYGQGAAGGTLGGAGNAATLLGCGGGGASGAGTQIGGNGASGYCLVQWIG